MSRSTPYVPRRPWRVIATTVVSGREFVVSTRATEKAARDFVGRTAGLYERNGMGLRIEYKAPSGLSLSERRRGRTP